VERLERLLRRIQATLDDAGEREVRDCSVKLWMEELMDLARDAEDVLDDHRYELLRRQVQERQEAAAAASSATVKRKHDGEDGTISEVTHLLVVFFLLIKVSCLPANKRWLLIGRCFGRSHAGSRYLQIVPPCSSGQRRRTVAPVR
jgi:hypothetical protein